jgi:acid phosphatase family membrane protein YuiD
MIWDQLITNRIMIASLIAWLLAQFLKVPIQYLVCRTFDWGMWFNTGGMPSSHSALVTAVMLATGLYAGFNTPMFAVALALMMVVVYDAAGVRRQAGMHAERINMIINELFSGQPISEENLKEVLGHTPVEVIGGVFLGLVVSWGVWNFWH